MRRVDSVRLLAELVDNLDKTGVCQVAQLHHGVFEVGSFLELDADDYRFLFRLFLFHHLYITLRNRFRYKKTQAYLPVPENIRLEEKGMASPREQ
jgi:hypothetical protein